MAACGVFMTDAKQKRVLAAIWPWRDSNGGKLSENAELRRRSTSQTAIVVCVAAVLVFGFHLRVMPAVLLCVATFLFVSARVFPPVFRLIDRGVTLLAVAVGSGLAWLLLAPFFYLCFLPARLILMLKGYDPLHRKCPSDEETYWTPRPPVGPGYYEKQY